MSGIKHLIECHCVLPQFRNRDNVIYHKFVVYSKFDSESDIVSRFINCNNCGTLHKIIDICKSEIVPGIENSISSLSEDDISKIIPERMSKILNDHKCDIATFEQVLDVINSEEWNTPVIISKQSIKGSTQIKTMTILNKSEFTIDSELFDNEIKRGF